MNKDTLAQLSAAYKAAPSPDLAKVLLQGYLELGDFNEVAEFLRQERVDLPASLLAYLLHKAPTVELISIIDQLCISHGAPIEVLEALVGLGYKDCAIQAHRRWCSNSTFDFESTADVEVLLGGQVSNERPKLRIVEKNENTNVEELIRYRESVTDFSDVVGLEAIKKQIHKKIIMPFQRPSLFQRFKKKVGGGVLLYGPPGCGKTLLARATAGECNASFYNIEVSDVLDMYIGESENKLKAIFEKARAETPSVLFFDELEALAGKREFKGGHSLSNTVSQFLIELDGFSQNNSGVLVLASTNVPWAIDSAFLRPGRFDRMFFVPPPDQGARADILAHHIKERPYDEGVDFEWIAKKTSGYSGADLANLVDMAADEAIDESIETEREVAINFSHLKQALGESRSTAVEWLTTARNYARYANDGGRYDDVIAFMKTHGKSRV